MKRLLLIIVVLSLFLIPLSVSRSAVIDCGEIGDQSFCQDRGCT